VTSERTMTPAAIPKALHGQPRSKLENLVLRKTHWANRSLRSGPPLDIPGKVFHAVGADLSTTLAGNVTRQIDRSVTVLRAVEIDQDPFRALV